MMMQSDEKNLALIKSRINGLLKSHYFQRIQLELALETLPRDSRYSDKLSDLIRREEACLQENPNAPSTIELTQKVDEALTLEIQHFFAKCSQENIKKWQNLNRKLEKDRITSKNEIFSDKKLASLISAEKSHVNSDFVDLDAEAKRLEEDYNKNWLAYEDFHLSEAFKSQAARIEAEWSLHENNLLEEYNKAISNLTGVHNVEVEKKREDKDQNRWQHPEKQKTLIHTAPVMSPKVDTSTKLRNKEQSNSVQAELEKIERNYKEAFESLTQQKLAATRWMARQKLRLTTQAREIDVERKFISNIIESELAEYNELLRY